MAAGLEVFATSGSEEKLERAKSLDITEGANYRRDGWAHELKAKSDGGFDIIVDGAGGADLNQLVKLSKPGGRIGLYGGTNGTVPDFSPQPVFWKQLSILGSTMGSDRDFSEMLDFVARHQIRPVLDSVFDLADGATAFQRMVSGQQFGKIVLRICQ
jgi:NADPH:quinone reductase-like Zn-dependent oxidoreductase